MGQKLLFISFLPKDEGARDMVRHQISDLGYYQLVNMIKLLKHLHAIADNALTKEPGVLQYIVTTAKGESTDPAVYAIEEYADEAAFQAHNQQDAVQELIKWLESGVLNSAPTIHQLEPLEGCNNFTRPEVANHADPFVAFSEVEYKPGTASKTHAYWQDIINTSRVDRLGTLAYGVWKDISQPNKLFMFHVYESMDYLMNVHVPSKPVQSMLENEKDIRIGLRPWMLQKREGYLYKDPK